MPPRPADSALHHRESLLMGHRLLWGSSPGDTVIVATASPDGGTIALVTRPTGARAMAHVARMLLEQASDALGDTPAGREDDILWKDIETALSYLPGPADDDGDPEPEPGEAA